MTKRLAFLLSGGKDSLYATYLAKKKGYKLAVAITIQSKNPESYMFHTPSILQTKKQADAMDLPIIIKKTEGKKEEELKDLKSAIKKAKEKYQVDGVITGAIGSVYQASRVQKICHELNLEAFNPLWQKPQDEVLTDLIKNNFEVILTGVFAYPFNEKMLGRKIDKKFTNEMKILKQEYQINSAGEGGEFETFVLNCPLFKKPLKIKDKKISGEKNSWRMELELK